MRSLIRPPGGENPPPEAARRQPARRRAGITAVLAAAVSVILALQLGAWLSPPAKPVALQQTNYQDEACSRVIEGTDWFFDPCIPEGAPLPPDVVSAIEEDRRLRECWASSPPSNPPTPTAPTPSGSPPPLTPGPGGAAVPAGAAVATESPVPSPSPCPTEPTESPSPLPSESVEPEPTGPEPIPAEPVCPDDDPSEPPALASADDTEQRRREARKDRIACPAGRRPTTPVVVVATGDSMTSAHIQWGYGRLCQRTEFDARRLTGNHAGISYVGQYVDPINTDVVEYYNFARTGYSTWDMRNVTGNLAWTADDCGNPWNRAFTPVDLADTAIRKAKADGRKAYFVSTGGVNNTNWGSIVQRLTMCRGLEVAAQRIRGKIDWFKVGGQRGAKADVINGGSCIYQTSMLGFIGRIRILIPTYDGPSVYQAIRDDVKKIVNTMIAAGADKVVWMLYHDISKANINIGDFALTLLRDPRIPWWIQAFLPVRLRVLWPLFDPVWQEVVKRLVNGLNTVIAEGVPVHQKVKATVSPLAPADIQVTAVGGCPHPNRAGHTKYAKTLDATFKAI
ncbi:MAG TPA: hypothetical protein VFC19_29310 [Candidatus Limnocylindrales bacterium]|nr:hypothetical protein [Candidatus Limnocylindrales bacterium]